MKNLKFIIFLSLLIQNYIQSSDDPGIIGYYIDDTSEPNTRIVTKIIKSEVPDQELSRKVDPETGRTTIHRLTSNPHYQPKAIPAEPDYTGVKFPIPKTRDDDVDPKLLKREEKFKEFRQQEKAATKIQAELRSRQAREKLKKIRKAEVAKILQARADEIQQEEADEKNQAELRSKEHKLFEDVSRNKSDLTVKIKTLADQSYPQFKELICTSDYLTKTDWLYQFIEAVTNKTIFERNSDGTINPEEFTPEFKKEIEKPSDWLDDKITKYLPEFHDLVYEIFVDKAVEQIVKNHSSWTAAVSIPAPKSHGSFQAEGTPLFPKTYKPSNSFSFDNELILGKIFVEILENDPEKFKQLHFQDFIKEISDSNLKIKYRIFDHIYHSRFPSIDNFSVRQGFYDYLKKSGLEFSPEDQLIFEDDFQSIDPYNKTLRFQKEQEKFIQDHINWASSARQTFYLGQLLFDKDLTAFEALGDQLWLEKQPQDIQEYIANYIEKLKTAQKQYALKKHVATENNSTTNSLTTWNTRVHNAFKGGMRSMWSKKE